MNLDQLKKRQEELSFQLVNDSNELEISDCEAILIELDEIERKLEVMEQPIGKES